MALAKLIWLLSHEYGVFLGCELKVSFITFVVHKQWNKRTRELWLTQVISQSFPVSLSMIFHTLSMNFNLWLVQNVHITHTDTLERKKEKEKKKQTLNHTDTTWTLMRTKSGPEIHFDPPNAALELLLWAQCLCVCFISFPPQSCQSIPSETAGTPPLWTKTLPLWPSSQACPGDFLTASLYCGSRSMSDRNQISTLGPPVDNKSSSSVASDGYESIWVINNAKNK